MKLLWLILFSMGGVFIWREKKKSLAGEVLVGVKLPPLIWENDYLMILTVVPSLQPSLLEGLSNPFSNDLFF